MRVARRRAHVAGPCRSKQRPGFPRHTRGGGADASSLLLGSMFVRLNGIPEPPEGYVPPLGSSRETWTNIYKNKGRIDYCVQQFGVSTG